MIGPCGFFRLVTRGLERKIYLPRISEREEMWSHT